MTLIANESEYLAKSDKTKFDLTLELCQFISKYPSRTTDLPLPAEQVLRQAVTDYPQEQGKLWIFLADYFTRSG